MDQSMELMKRFGESKMDKLQREFTQTHKETGIRIIQELGTDAFALWWYIEGYCFGEKVHAYPSKKTMEKDLGKNERTIQRWEKKLEEAGAMKRVPGFLPSGYRTTNVVLINAAFPDIPEGWDEVFKYGVIINNKQISPRENPDEVAPDKSVGTDKSAFNEHEQHMVLDVETQENSPRQICRDHDLAPDKSVTHSVTDLSPSILSSNPSGSKDESGFPQGGRIKEEEQEIKQEEEEENIYTQQQTIFEGLSDFLNIDPRMQRKILLRIGSLNEYTSYGLYNTFQVLRDRLNAVAEGKKQPIEHLPAWFLETLEGEDTKILMLDAAQKRVLREKQKEEEAARSQRENSQPFPFYNWLEEE